MSGGNHFPGPSLRGSEQNSTRFAHAAGALALTLALAAPSEAQFRKIGEMELRLSGMSATPENLEPVVPKNTPGGVRIIVRAGGVDLSLTDLSRFLGASFIVQGELSGPGFSQPISLPDLRNGGELPADPLVIPTPPIPIAGDYRLSNLRIVAQGRTVLDVEPSTVPLKVIDQILVTRVTTRPLTLDEIKAKGIVLDSDDYLGFEFTMGFKLDSKVVDLKFPVVFDRQGVAVPQPLSPPAAPVREGVQLPTILPVLMSAEDEAGLPVELPRIQVGSGTPRPLSIPAVLVIPGNVGYLKQFFSAQLYVSNGAPVGSILSVREVKARLKLPPGADLLPGTADDPLALPELERDGQVITQPLIADIRGIGPDGVANTDDDVAQLGPAEQGQAEFLIRGEKEGFHQIDFDLTGKLLGLPIGPVTVRGKATGGVLVRNPFFNVTFTVPSVVRRGEHFKMRATVTNIGKGIGNDVSMTLDSSRISGLLLEGDPAKHIDTLKPGDAKTLEFGFVAQRTGKVVATYLKFDTASGATGDLKFTIGVGERNVPLSPDTLVLPASTDLLPPTVVDAAMRVLGQAWSIANAPSGTLPAGVIRINGQVVVKKALALAEAGLRVTLGQSQDGAVRDLLTDFFSGDPVDPGFDQLLRTTEAGHDFVRAVGEALGDAAIAAGGATGYELETSRVVASAGPFVSFGWDGVSADVTATDATGRTTARSTDPAAAPALTAWNVLAAVLMPLGSDGLLGLVTQPTSGPYVWQVRATHQGVGSISMTFARSDGSFGRMTWSGSVEEGTVIRVVPDGSGGARVMRNLSGDGVFETNESQSINTLPADGPTLVAAAVIGPETLDGAGPWGFQTALVFDRVVGESSASAVSKYTVPDNIVRIAKRQLSGRIVFAGLTLPEGPYVPTRVGVSGLEDTRGIAGPDATVPFTSRLEEIGAVVSGRVLDAEGMPLSGRSVVYIQNLDLSCQFQGQAPDGMAAPVTDSLGRFELRYARQDQCGQPFQLKTKDPSSGALRTQSFTVVSPAQQIVADFVMLAAGAVSGTVKNLSGSPVSGARVSVLSQTETQVGASSVTDAFGRYAVSGITVGPVAVRAGKGNGVGSAAGRIDRPSVPAVIDVTIDGGAVSVHGVVRKVEDGVAHPAAGAVVTYSLVLPGFGLQAMAAIAADAQGGYAFSGLPVGQFNINAQATSRDSAAVTGVAVAGDDLTRDISVEIPPAQSLGYVSGGVVLPNGAEAEGAIVTSGGASVLSGTGGAFRIPVRPQLSAHTVSARTRDGKRSGFTTAIVNQAGQEATGVLITLSGLGAAEFTVLDTLGQPLPGRTVRLLDSAVNPCGRTNGVTDALGRVTFSSLGLGSVTGQVVNQAEITDAARARVSVSGDGSTAFAVLRVETRGATLSGVVVDPSNHPVFGADVDLQSPAYAEDFAAGFCGMRQTVTHRARTGVDGRFTFSGIHPGLAGVTARQDFFPTAVAQQINLSPGQSAAVTLTLVDTISGEISGTVSEPDGSHAGAGVEVTLNGALPDVTVVTDALGHFRFPKIFPQGAYTLTAREPATGLVERMTIYIARAVDAIHDVRLKGKALVRVSVVDDLARPVGQAYLTLREIAFPSRSFEGVVAPSNQGVVEFPGVFEGSVSIEVKDPFGRGGRASLTIPSGVTLVNATVRISTTGTVRGRFLMPAGNDTPIPYGAIKLFASGRLVGQVTASGADPIGSFEFKFVPAGAFRLEALDPLTGRTGLSTGTIDTEGQLVEADVRAQGIGTVLGLVTSNGVGAPGARVELVSGGYSATTIADSTGRYIVQGVPEGRVVASADSGNGFLRATTSAVLQGEGSTLTLDIALRGSGAISGHVLKANGAPAGVAGVSLFVGGVGGGTVTGSTNEAGDFFFDRVPAGLAQINIDALGSDDFATGSFEVPAGGEVSAALTLNGIGGLTGHGRDSAGNPTTGRVTIQGGPALKRYYYVIDLAPDGRFELPRVLAGAFTVTLQSTVSGLTLFGTGSGTVADSQITDIDVRLQDSGTVTGRILRADGVTPAAGASVTLQLASIAQTTLQAQNDGRFTFRGATLGVFTVRVADPVTAGVARATGSLGANGQTVDLGNLVLDDSLVQVVSVDPADGAVGVSVTQPLRLTFSDPLGSAFGFRVMRGSQGVGTGFGATLSPDARTVTLTGLWPDSSELTIQADTTVTDIYGRHPAQTFTGHFTTQDLTPPGVTAVVPANGAIQTPSSATLTVTFSEPLSAATNLTTLVQLIQEGPNTVLAGQSALTSPNVVLFTPATALPLNAQLRLTVSGAIDQTGNLQTSAFVARFKTVDTVPPILALSAPSPGGWTTNRRPTIVVALSDALSGVDGSTGVLRVDGADTAATRSGASLVFTPTGDLNESQHTVEASVRDLASNVGTLSASFGVDATPPSAAVITSGVGPGAVAAGSVTLAAAGSDATSGVARIDILEGAAVRATLLPPSFSTTYNTNFLAEGAHTFTARAVDVAGNVGVAGDPVSFFVDNHILTLAVTAPVNNLRIKDAVVASATPSEPVARVVFAVGGVSVEDLTAPYSATLDTASLVQGTYTLTATAYALTGEPTSASVLVFVDRTPPPDPDTTRITADDQGNGLAQVAGLSGAAEAGATIEARKVGSAISVTTTVANDGSFATRVAAIEGDFVEIRALDSVGNASQWLPIRVTRSVNADGIPQNGMALWVKADAGITTDGSGQVTAWADQSGHANHLLQATSTRRPALVANGFNGYPVLRFDGNSDFFNLTTRLAGTIRTVFWVVKEDPAAAVGRRSLLGDATAGNDFRGGASGTVWASDATAAQTLNGSTFVNGAPVSGATATRPKSMSVVSIETTSGTSASLFGTSFGASEFWWGDLAEMVIYDRPLTDSERKQVEDYLAQKYRPYVPAVGAPRISPAGGVFSGSTTITLTSQTPGSALYYTLDGSDPSESARLYDSPFTISATTTIRTRAFKAGLDPSSISTAGLTRSEEAPPSSGLAVWVRADAGISTDAIYITSWADQSGRGNHLTQTTGTKVPVLVQNAANGLPALRFDGNSDLLNFTTRLAGAIRTVFWVVREDAAAPAARRSLLGDASTGNDFRGGSAGTLWASDATATQTVNGSTFINGLPVVGTATPRPKSMSVISLVTTSGASANFFGTSFGTQEFWWGDLAEMIIYDRALTSSERAEVEGYLTAKYAIGGEVVPPSVSPNGGIFTGEASVAITTPTQGAEIHYTLDGSDPSVFSPLYDQPFVLSATATVKARAFKAGLADSRITTVGFTKDTDFTPRAVLGMKLWWRADAGVASGLGDHIEDQSGNGNHGFQSSSGGTPVLVQNAANGLPALQFDGSSDFLNFTTRVAGTIRTAFWVVREDAAAPAARRSLLGDASTGNDFRGGSAGTLWASDATATQTVNGSTFINGLPIAGTATPRPNSMSVISLVTTSGASANFFGTSFGTQEFWWGDLAEMIIYDRALTSAERAQVEGYLEAKYAIGTKAGTPAVSPDGGLFTTEVSISITTATPDAQIRYTLDGTDPTSLSPLYSGTLSLNATATVKAKAFKAGLADSGMTTVGFTRDTDFTPKSLSGIKLWWRADAGVASGLGDRIDDQSGDGNHGIQSASAATSVLIQNAINGLPALRFDGNSDYLRLSSRLAGTIRTVFWVVKEDVSATVGRRNLLGDASAGNDFRGGSAGTLWASDATAAQTLNGSTFLNGVSVNGPATTRPKSMSVISLVTTSGASANFFGTSFAATSEFWWGDLAELVIYDRALSTTERQQVEAYLKHKYGTP